jgi:HNH endonuclease
MGRWDIKEPMLSRLERFYIPEPNSGCWLWIGYVDKLGYGCMRGYPGKTRKPHRVSYELHKGAIPEGLVLDHLCRNPCCINPDHLDPVTDRQNILRSELTSAAKNLKKTHCEHGHLLQGENLRYHKDGSRRCVTCDRLGNARRWPLRKDKARKWHKVYYAKKKENK